MSASADSGRIFVNASIPFDYVLRKPSGAKEAFVLLHGYGHAGSVIFDRLAEALPVDAVIVAPNSPFPIPEKVGGKYRVGYSWYFYDPATREYFIDMKPSIGFLRSGIEALGLGSIPKTIIGFSQGGYLAPFAAQKLLAVRQVIGIGAEYLPDEIEGDVPFRMDMICGDQDKLFTPEEVIAGDAGIRARGIAGETRILPGVGHEMNGSVRSALRELIARA